MISVAPGALADPAVLPILPLTRFLKRVSRAVGLDGEVDVLLASDAELRRLNREFRSKNKATDVLSFPAEPMPGLPAGRHHAGDLAISVDTAARQAEEHGHALATEVRVLLLHGLLHLAGMDHESDAGEMRDREAELRAQLRLPTSLIERATLSGSERPTAPSSARRPARTTDVIAKAGRSGTPGSSKRGARP